MKWLWRGLRVLWELFGIAVVLAVGWTYGQQAGYGRGARAVFDLIWEMRQSSYETPDPWDRGEI